MRGGSEGVDGGRLAFLAFLSGACGIAYEVLCTRLLTTYLGDMFHVAGAILASFLCWLGVGALAARRLEGKLWLVEAVLGFNALAVALLAAYARPSLLEWLAPLSARAPEVTVVAVFILVAIPAGLAGFGVPLFSLALARADGGGDSPFRTVYRSYNLGAALFVLSLEVALLPALGIAGSFAAMGGLNLAVAAALFRSRTVRPPRSEPAAPEAGRWRLLTLFTVSAASGVHQLLMLRFVKTLFGPYHENFAYVVALGLLGIWAGTGLLSRLRMPTAVILLRGAVALAAGFALLGGLIHVWGYLNGLLGAGPWSTRGVKLLMLLLLGGVPAAFFGAAVPALLGDPERSEEPVGRALACSCFGNCAGYLATVLVLHDRTGPLGMALVVTALPLAAGWALLVREGGGRRREWGLALAAAAAILPLWPHDLLEMSYWSLRSPAALAAALESLESTTTYRKFGQALSIVSDKRGHETLVIEGYQSLVVAPGRRANLREVLFGMSPALFSARRESALVLGIGTGLTAGTVAGLYDRVRAVDVHPAVFDLLQRYAPINGLAAALTAGGRAGDASGRGGSANVELALEDALTSLAAGDARYDAIVNTVTSPLFFSSAKLYTRDFFELAASRLAPGGVYVFWFDSAVTESGARTVFRTVQEVFPYCNLLFLTRGYTQVICGLAPLAVNELPPGAWPAHVRDKFRAHGVAAPPTDFVKSLLFPGERIATTAWDAPVNTFDRPALEFVMAPSAINEELRPLVIYDLLGLDFSKSWLGRGPMPDETLALRAVAFRILGAMDLIEAARRGPLRGVSPRFVDLALPALGPEVCAPWEAIGYARDMWQQREDARALHLLERMGPLPRATSGDSRGAALREQALWLRLSASRRSGRPVGTSWFGEYCEAYRDAWLPGLGSSGGEAAGLFDRATAEAAAGAVDAALRSLAALDGLAAAQLDPDRRLELARGLQALRVELREAATGLLPVEELMRLFRLEPWDRYLREKLRQAALRDPGLGDVRRYEAVLERLGRADESDLALSRLIRAVAIPARAVSK